MSARATGATALRILRQIRHDPRTIALLLVVPAVPLLLLYWVFEGEKQVFQEIGAPLCGLFPFIIMFLVTSISMLRERTTGTLERLMTLPLGKADILTGYASRSAFSRRSRRWSWSRWALPSSTSTRLMAPGWWDSSRSGTRSSAWPSASSSAPSRRPSSRRPQFMPALIFPQLILCGLFVPRDQMAGFLEAISWLLPLTYAFEALAKATSHKPLGAAFAADVLVIVGLTIAALGMGGLTLRRRTG